MLAEMAGEGESRYRIAEVAESIRPVALRYFCTCGSTHDLADSAARAGSLVGPTLFLTSRQVSGRGRAGNTWWSGRGCITATLAFPTRAGMNSAELSIRAVAAIHRAILDTSDLPVLIKWPNDLLLHDRKLGGVLCARSSGFDLVGFGINDNLDRADAPDELRDAITSLAALGTPVDLTHLVARICQSLRSHLFDKTLEPFSAVLGWYSRHHRLTGLPVQVYLPDGRSVCGTCTGLTPTGQLLLQAGPNTEALSAGHVVWSAAEADRRES